MANVKENFEEDSLQQLGHVVQVRCSVVPSLGRVSG